MENLRDLFSLDPTIHFLNHGSFGACPIPVFECYQSWQRRLERQPVLFLGRELDGLLLESRQALGGYLGADADELVYVPNATHGVNIVAHSLDLKLGDEVLTSDHEYGACDYAWEFICERNGASYVHQAITLPVETEDEILERFWRGVTPRTKAIYISHITSPTALRLPVEKLCRRAREAGILTVIDGAHAPGQIALDLHALGADFYTGNCHKWMLAPKGSAFLYVRRDVQRLVWPLVVSWGYHPTPLNTTGSRFIDLFQWTGTKDPTAALAVPAAIEFMREHHWETVRSVSHVLLGETIRRVCDLTGQEPAYPIESDLYGQMGIAPLPPGTNTLKLKAHLYDDFRVEVPLTEWQGRSFVRISIQGYNSLEDVDALVKGLKKLL